MNLADDVLRLLVGTDSARMASPLADRTIRDRLTRWRAANSASPPVSIGDALARELLARTMGASSDATTRAFESACRTADGAYLPIPATDDRWGRVTPVADVYATVQGTLLHSLLNNELESLARGREAVAGMIDELPFNTLSSDTLLAYRKLSEVLLQAHYSAILAQVRPCVAPNHRLRAAYVNAYRFASEQRFGTEFATPLFRLTMLARTPDFACPAPTWGAEEVEAAVDRLSADDGMAEYLLADKVDERAGSKSRSRHDHDVRWTYATAYGVIVLGLWGRRGSDTYAGHVRALTRRLEAWPDGEDWIRIKQLPTAFGGGPAAWTALVSLAALAHAS